MRIVNFIGLLDNYNHDTIYVIADPNNMSFLILQYNIQANAEKVIYNFPQTGAKVSDIDDCYIAARSVDIEIKKENVIQQ